MTDSYFFVERLFSAPCSICFESCIELVLVINNRKSSATGSRWTKGKSSTLHRLRANLKQSSTDVNSRENHLPGQGGHHLLRAHTRRYFYSRVGAFICSRPTIESCDVKKCVHQIMLDLLVTGPPSTLFRGLRAEPSLAAAVARQNQATRKLLPASLSTRGGLNPSLPVPR